LRIAILAALVLTGVGLRAIYLPAPALWVDEAESAINGMSILKYGVPVGEYLDIPVFENTLVRHNATDPEYAFDDASYNRDGLAIYHGWLPLYAIALSQRLFGIEPGRTQLAEPPSLAEARLRTLAARLPAVVFSAAFLVMIFLLARSSFGEVTAWTTLVAAVFSWSLIWLGHQSRYYSLTLLLTATVLFLLLRLARHGRTGDYAMVLGVYVLLFYTHLLSFFVAVVSFAALLPWLARHRHWFGHVVALAAVGSTLTIPWLVYTDYFSYLGEVPRAWPLLEMPKGLFIYPSLNIDMTILYLIGMVILIAVWWFGRDSHRGHMLDWELPVYLIVVWGVVAYLAYLFLIPAPSFFFNRISLVVLVPGTVLAAAVLSYLAHFLSAKHTIVVAPILCLVFLVVTEHVQWLPAPDIDNVDTYAPVNQLDALGLSASARYYAPPNDQLPLSYYSGLAFQSIAPIRKTYLGEWPGEIVLVEKAVTKPNAEIISARALIEAATAAGEPLSNEDAVLLSRRLASRPEREQADAAGFKVVPPLSAVPGYAEPLLDAYRALLRERTAKWLSAEGDSPIRAGFEMNNATDWWNAFFYRFVDPESRSGDRANYYQRMCGAEMFLEPGAYWKVSVSRHPVDSDFTCAEAL
jgi:hypothetical protein